MNPELPCLSPNNLENYRRVIPDEEEKVMTHYSAEPEYQAKERRFQCAALIANTTNYGRIEEMIGAAAKLCDFVEKGITPSDVSQSR